MQNDKSKSIAQLYIINWNYKVGTLGQILLNITNILNPKCNEII